MRWYRYRSLCRSNVAGEARNRRVTSLNASIKTVVVVAVLAAGAGAAAASAAAGTHHPATGTDHLRRYEAKKTDVTETVGAKVTGAGHSRLQACTSAARGRVQPDGRSGAWTRVFDDELSGTSINTHNWTVLNGYTNQNSVTTSSRNISVDGGCAILTLASSDSGAEMRTSRFALKVGEFAEARIQFAGSGTKVYDWPAFWSAGPGWPATGEQDIFEGSDGTATVNYHFLNSQGRAAQAGPFTIRGNWAGAFHIYGIYHGSRYCYVYWDGKLVKRYPTDDTGGGEGLIFTEGSNDPLVTGAASDMLVDYVRVWRQR